MQAENNGMTTKELIMMVIENNKKLTNVLMNYEKTNSKLSKTEFFSYMGIIISFSVLLQTMM